MTLGTIISSNQVITLLVFKCIITFIPQNSLDRWLVLLSLFYQCKYPDLGKLRGVDSLVQGLTATT